MRVKKLLVFALVAFAVPLIFAVAAMRPDIANAQPQSQAATLELPPRPVGAHSEPGFRPAASARRVAAASMTAPLVGHVPPMNAGTSEVTSQKIREDRKQMKEQLGKDIRVATKESVEKRIVETAPMIVTQSSQLAPASVTQQVVRETLNNVEDPQFAGPPMPEPSAASLRPIVPVPSRPQSQSTSPSSIVLNYSRMYQSDWRIFDDYAPYEGFAIVVGDKCLGVSLDTTVYGNCSTAGSRLMDRVKSLREKIRGNFIWFRLKGKTYITTDPGTVSRGASLFEPFEKLIAQQEELGHGESLLGEQQRKLREEQSPVREEQSQVRMKGIDVTDFLTQLQEIEAQLKEISATGATQQQLSILQSRVSDLRVQIATLRSRAEAGESKIRGQRAALGQQRALLARARAKLGRQRAALSVELREAGRRGAAQMKALLDDALARSLAKRAPK